MTGALAIGVAGLLWSWSAAVVVTSGVGIVRGVARRRARGPALPTARWPSVLVVRPCAGLEPHLRRSLRSTASLRYRGPVRVVSSTSTPDDPARPVLLDVARWLRERGMDARVQVVPPRGANLKASQLAGIVDDAPDEIALVVDSDVELHDLDLEPMIGPLLDPRSGIAAVWCAPVEREPIGLGDRLSAAVLGGSLHAFTLLGGLDRGGLVGKTFAVRISALRAVGGFSALVQHLGEDLELARRLATRRWSCSLAAPTVTSLACGRRVADTLARYSRWLMVLRAQRPAMLVSYPLLLAATPGLVVAWLLADLAGLSGAGIGLLTTVLTRSAVTVAARRLAGRSLAPGGVLLDSVLADALLLAAFARAVFGPARVRWRERTLRIGPHGRLEPG